MILDDIIAALVAAGLGQSDDSAADWMIYGNYMQATPAKAICVYTAGGPPPETRTPADYPNIQIKVRGAADGFEEMAAKEEAIYLFLQAGDAPAQFGDAYVYCYAIQSSPIPMGQDENRQPAAVRNYRFMKARA